MKSIKDIKIYNNFGKTADNLTVVFPWDKNPRNGYVAMIAMSAEPFHPQGICQHSEGTDGPHLGKRISYVDLNDDCAKVILMELAAYNSKN